jgi:hypothetical protein
MEKIIRFRDLSIPNKIAISVAWTFGIAWAIGFLAELFFYY